MMTSYFLAKALLLIALIVITRIVLRKPASASHLALRRLAMLVLIIFACIAVVFPSLLNTVAHMIGIERGINLLVYCLVLALFTQMANSYRRDADAEARLTLLARAIALSDLDRRRNPESEPDTSNDTPSRIDSATPEDDASRYDHTR